MIVYALFVLWPLVQTGWLALQRWDGYGPQTFVGLQNLADLWQDAAFRDALTHSLWWELAAAVIPTVLGFGLALLARSSGRRGVVLASLFVPVLLPATAVAAVWWLVYSPLSGLLNTMLRDVGLGGLARGWLGDLGLALRALFVAWLWSAIGIGTLLIYAGLRSIGREYLELAAVEGAGPLQRFRHVLLPALRRPLLLAALINAALAAQVFDLIFTTTGGGPGDSTMLIPLDMYGRAFGGLTGQGAMVACVYVVLCVGLALVAILSGRRGEDFVTGEEHEGAPGGFARPAGTVAGLLVALAVLLPLIWLLLVAAGAAGTSPGASAVGINPLTWQWDNLASAWHAGMGAALARSIALAAAVVALSLLIAAPAAYALTRLVGSRSIRLAIGGSLLVGLFQPTPVLIIPLFTLLGQLHLLNSAWGVILPEVARGLPFSILILWAFMVQLPAHVLEAAEIDGATPLRQLLQIAIPLARPAVAVVAVWAFVTSWNEYLLPTLVSQDGSLQTVPTLLGSFIGRYNTQFGPLAAGALMAVLPSLALFLIARRPAAAGLPRIGRRNPE